MRGAMETGGKEGVYPGQGRVCHGVCWALGVKECAVRRLETPNTELMYLYRPCSSRCNVIRHVQLTVKRSDQGNDTSRPLWLCFRLG